MKPWEWEEMLDRATAAEIERVIDGALWREERLRDLLGWHSLFSGMHKEGTRLTALLGRNQTLLTSLTGHRPTPPQHIEPLTDEQMARSVAAIDAATLRRQRRTRGQKDKPTT